MTGTHTRTYQCPPDHAHCQDGKVTCYTNHKCGCFKCRRANAAYAERRRRDQAYGRIDGTWTAAEPIREHIRYLRSHGMGSPTISRLSGIPQRTILGIMNTRHGPRVITRTAAAVLAVEPLIELMPSGAQVDARGVRRRVEALIAVGWTEREIARRLDCTAQKVNLMHHTGKVTARTHCKVAALYETLSAQVPPPGPAYVRAIARARQSKWPVPMAWDDIDTDVAPAQVEHISYYDHFDEVAVDLTLQGHKPRRLTPPENDECVRRLHARKMSDAAIGYRLGMSERQVERIRHGKLGLPGWDKTEQYTNIETDRRAAA